MLYVLYLMMPKEPVRVDLNIFIADIENEFAVSEPDLKLTLQSETPRKMAIDQDTSSFMKHFIQCPHGVYAMSQDILGLIETSTNLASIKMIDSKKIKIETSQRSSYPFSQKMT